MTICLLLTLSILFTPITVKANDNSTKHELPTAGFSEFITINIYEIKEVDLTASKYTKYSVKNHSGLKSYMSYKALTSKSSYQYQLQQKANTDENGFRKVHNRYCVAIGTAFNADVGQYLDVELENGTIIKCIVGDIKADNDTDKSNIFTKNGCCLEFIVGIKYLDETCKIMGDCSNLYDEWNSPCKEYRVYDINVILGGD